MAQTKAASQSLRDGPAVEAFVSAKLNNRILFMLTQTHTYTYNKPMTEEHTTTKDGVKRINVSLSAYAKRLLDLMLINEIQKNGSGSRSKILTIALVKLAKEQGLSTYETEKTLRRRGNDDIK